MKRRSLVGAVVAGGVSGALLLPGGPADATRHTTSALANGGHLLIFHADEHEGSGDYHGLEYWENFRDSESAPLLDSICNYQSQMVWIHSNGQILQTQTTGRYGGCVLQFAYFDWSNWESWYVENTGFDAKWRSDTTSGATWQDIGTLRD